MPSVCNTLKAIRLVGRAVSIVGISAGMGALQGCGPSRVFQTTAEIPTMPTEQQLAFAADSTLQKDSNPKEMLLMGEPPIETSTQAMDDSLRVGDAVDEKPQFPGGDEALIEYMKYNLRYPDEVCGQGRVVVTFMVEKDGSISEAKVVRSVCKEFDEEALRMVNAMPKWKPGKQQGIPVRTEYTLPVIFRLE